MMGGTSSDRISRSRNEKMKAIISTPTAYQATSGLGRRGPLLMRYPGKEGVPPSFALQHTGTHQGFSISMSVSASPVGTPSSSLPVGFIPLSQFRPPCVEIVRMSR